MYAPEKKLSTGCASTNRFKSIDFYPLNFLTCSFQKLICQETRLKLQCSAGYFSHLCFPSHSLSLVLARPPLVNDHNPRQVGETGSLLLRPMCLLLSRELRPLWREALTSCGNWSVTWQCQHCPWGLGFSAQCVDSTTPCTNQYEDWNPPLSLKQLVCIEPLWALSNLRALSSTQGLVDLLQ